MLSFDELINMALLTGFHENQLIHQFFGANKGYKYVQDRILEHGYVRSVSSIWRVINNVGKKRQSLISGQEFKYERSFPILTKSNVGAIEKQFKRKPNPPTFRQASQDLNMSKSSVHRAVSKKLGLKKETKIKLHFLAEKDKRNRKANSRKLYDRIRGKQSKYVVSLDESWISKLLNQSKRPHYYVDPRAKKRKNYRTCETKFPAKIHDCGRYV